jgi:hypothetical protein
MSLLGRTVHRKGIIPQHLHPSKFGQYSLCNFDTLGTWVDGTVGYGPPTGTSANLGLGFMPCAIGGSLPILYYQNGTQTIVAPTFGSAGLKISGDLTDTEGVDYAFGVGADNVARGKHVFQIGATTSDGVPNAFFARATITAADVSGITSLLFGFRKVQAFQTAVTGYTDLCAVGLVATDGNITVRTRLNNGTAVATDTTLDWADTETKILNVQVRMDGKARVVILPSTSATAAPTIAAFPAFTFDVNDYVIPFLDLLHATTSPGLITISNFECGFMMDNSVDVTV